MKKKCLKRVMCTIVLLSMIFSFIPSLSFAEQGVTWNPNDKNFRINLSADMLTTTATYPFGNGCVRATVGKNSGKWYWEVKVLNGTGDNGDNEIGIGSASTSLENFSCGEGNGYGYYDYGRIHHQQGYTSGQAVEKYYVNDIIGIALNLDDNNGEITFYKNGVQQGSKYTNIKASISGDVYPMVGHWRAPNSVTANFGASPFSYPVPEGYLPYDNITPVSPLPGAPTGLSATANNTQISLSWNAAGNATSYKVKRSLTSGGTYTTIAENIASTSYIDTTVTEGTTYYYVVSAVNDVGESINSAEVSAIPSSSSYVLINDSVFWGGYQNSPGFEGIKVKFENDVTLSHISLRKVNDSRTFTYVPKVYQGSTLLMTGASGTTPTEAAAWCDSYLDSPITLQKDIEYTIGFECSGRLIGLYQSSEQFPVTKYTVPGNQKVYLLGCMIDTTLYTSYYPALKLFFDDTPTPTPTPTSAPLVKSLITSIAGGTITLTWDAAADAESYDVDVNGIITNVGLSTIYTLDNISLGTQYTIKVRANNASAVGDWISTVINNNSTVVANLNQMVVQLESDMLNLSIQENIDAAMIKANDAKILLNTLPDSVERTDLQARISSIQTKINIAIININLITINGLLSNPTQDSIAQAATKINELRLIFSQIPDCSDKTSIVTAISNAQTSIQTARSEILVHEIPPLTSVNTINAAKDILASMKAEYNLLPEGTYKTELKVRIDEIEAKINIALVIINSSITLTSTVGVDSITLSWNAVPYPTEYEIEIDGVVQTVTATTYTHSGLGSFTGHTYRVRAKNVDTYSNWSAIVSVKTLLAIPASFAASAPNSTSITLDWASVQNATGYEIKVDDNNVICVGNVTTYVHADLIPNVEHSYVIRALNGNEHSEWSTPVKSTPVDNTAPVINITGVANGSNYTDSVLPGIIITDNESGIKTSTITLDGNIYTSGTPVTAPGLHTLTVEAVDLGNNPSTVSIIFTIFKSTTLNVTATNAQYGDKSNISATLMSGGSPVSNKTVEFILGTPSGNVNIGTSVTNASGQAILDYIVDKPQGSYTISALFSEDGPDYLRQSGSNVTLDVSKENATISYTGQRVILYSAGEIPLSAKIEQDEDESLEGITKAKVKFDVFSIGNAGVETLYGSYTASCNTNGEAMVLQNLPLGVYSVEVSTVDEGYYTPSTDKATISVYDTKSGFITGGGWVNAQDIINGTSGRANMGFEAKYNPDNTIKGNFEFQYKTGDMNFKCTQLNWLVINADNAQFEGVGTIKDRIGIFTFRVNCTDDVSASSPDRITISIWDGTDTSATPIYQVVDQVMNGGNIVIHNR